MTISINDLIEKVRSGEVEGSIEIIVRNKGRVNTLIVKKESNTAPRKRLEVSGISLEKTDLSGMDLSNSDLSGINLTGANLSYATINNADLSYANLEHANFYKAKVSQTNMSNSSGANASGAYMTGSVNLYNPQTRGRVWRESVMNLMGDQGGATGYDVFEARARKNRGRY